MKNRLFGLIITLFIFTGVIPSANATGFISHNSVTPRTSTKSSLLKVRVEMLQSDSPNDLFGKYVDNNKYILFLYRNGKFINRFKYNQVSLWHTLYLTDGNYTLKFPLIPGHTFVERTYLYKNDYNPFTDVTDIGGFYNVGQFNFNTKDVLSKFREADYQILY